MKLLVYEDRKHNQWLQIGTREPDIRVMRLRDGDILADVSGAELKKDWLYLGKLDPNDRWEDG